MKDAIKDGLRRWKDFSGRSSRRQYWWFTGFFLTIPLFLQVITTVVLSFSSTIITVGGMGLVSIMSITFLLLIPAQIAANVRRLHDVGKSGIYMLIPIYNLYLYIQPSKEQGRIPFWQLLEKIALVFIFLPLFGIIEGDFETSIGGSITWLAIYLTIRWFNGKEKRKLLKTP